MLKSLQTVAMVAASIFSLRTTKKEVREANAFGYAPIVEVAVLFIGIFLHHDPGAVDLRLTGASGASSGSTSPGTSSGPRAGLSGFLDNAPTYLTFTAAASGLHHTDPNVLSELIASSGQVGDGRPGIGYLRARRDVPRGGRLRRCAHGRDHVHRQRTKLHGQGHRRAVGVAMA